MIATKLMISVIFVCVVILGLELTETTHMIPAFHCTRVGCGPR